MVRPLINTKKNQLIYISKKVFKFYLTDPSNLKIKFLRTRIRNYLDKFKLEGLDINKIKLTLSNLQSANESINFYKEKSIKNYVRYLQHNLCLVSYDLFNHESEEVIFRTISDIISKYQNKELGRGSMRFEMMSVMEWFRAEMKILLTKEQEETITLERGERDISWRRGRG